MEERRKTPRARRGGRKLLAATLGLATVTLTGCMTTGNLIAPPPQDSGIDGGVDGGESDAGEASDAGDAASTK